VEPQCRINERTWQKRIAIVKSVEARKTQSGKTLFVLTDDTGREYTTLKEPIARRRWTRSDEVAWRTAIDAAPYILSGDAVEKEVPPEEFFEKLKPLKDLVADDIRSEDDGEAGLDDDAGEKSQ
jgi:hypothetical protein